MPWYEARLQVNPKTEKHIWLDTDTHASLHTHVYHRDGGVGTEPKQIHLYYKT